MYPESSRRASLASSKHENPGALKAAAAAGANPWTGPEFLSNMVVWISPKFEV